MNIDASSIWTATKQGASSALGFAAAAMPFVGMAGSLLSSIGEASQKKSWAKYQAKQAKADGYAALSAAHLEAKKIRQAGKTVQSQAVASIADSGVKVGDGSAALLEKDILQRAEEDAWMAIFDGQDALNRSLAQAKAYKIQGDAEFKAGLWNSAGSLFGLAGAGLAAASKWLKPEQTKQPFGFFDNSNPEGSSRFFINGSPSANQGKGE